MKPKLLLLLAGCLLALWPSACAQPATSVIQPYQVTDISQHHRTWTAIVVETEPDGSAVQRTRSFIELQTGLNYIDNSQWRESVEQIELYPGGAVAQRGPYIVIFSPRGVSI